jgi:hypothetical protein
MQCRGRRILFPSYLSDSDSDVFYGRVEVVFDGGYDRDNSTGICVLKSSMRTGGWSRNSVEAVGMIGSAGSTYH